jgi:hypothetical protein
MNKLKSTIVALNIIVMSMALVAISAPHAAMAIEPSMPLDITASAPDGTVGKAYFARYVVVGGVGPYRWDIVRGAFAKGLAYQTSGGMNSELVVSGTPTEPWTQSITFKVTDSGNAQVVREFPQKIAPAQTTTTGTTPTTNTGGTQGTSPTKPNSSGAVGAFTNPINVSDIPTFIIKVIKILLSLTGILAVLFIIIGGLRMITSAGNTSAVKAGKDTIQYALFGLILAVLSYAIVQVVTNVLIK